MHSSQCCCCFCYDFGRAVDAECQERSKLFVVDRKILCCLSTVSCKPPANSPMNNRDCFYVHSVLFIFRNAPQSPKQKLQHSHFGILSLSDTCTAHTHTLSLPHSLLFLRMWHEGSDKKKTPWLLRTDPFHRFRMFRKAVPAVTVRCWHKRKKSSVPSLTHSRLHQKPRLIFFYTDHHQYDDNVWVPIFIRDDFHSKKKDVHCPLLKALRRSTLCVGVIPFTSSSSFSIHALH